jgi:hypothetical protein
MTAREVKALLEHLHRTGALSLPPSDLQAVVEMFGR